MVHLCLQSHFYPAARPLSELLKNDYFCAFDLDNKYRILWIPILRLWKRLLRLWSNGRVYLHWTEMKFFEIQEFDDYWFLLRKRRILYTFYMELVYVFRVCRHWRKSVLRINWHAWQIETNHSIVTTVDMYLHSSKFISLLSITELIRFCLISLWLLTDIYTWFAFIRSFQIRSKGEEGVKWV